VDPVKLILFSLLALVAVVFVAYWTRKLGRNGQWDRPTREQTVIGFITDFLDTLGIGSFAVTTTLYRFRRTIADELIPGTLNVGHAIPTIVQAFIYIAIIQVEMRTLALTILAAVLGAWLGAAVVTRWPRRRIQCGMGLALLAAAGFILRGLIQGDPSQGTSTGLDGGALAVALIGNFIFGSLMMIGVGAYAPIMVMVCLLGMHQKTALPIMMGSCAFLMPTAGIRFIRAGAYDARAALGLTVGGIPAVLLAAYIVKELPLKTMQWLVVVVVIYTGISLLVAASREKPAPSTVAE
jgi:uncharacterized membrane protein YfcA